MAKIGIIGLGYVGLTSAVGMTSLGHTVIGFDIDKDKLALLTSGKAPFFEPDLQERLISALEAGKLRFTDNLRALASESEFLFVCVPTPQAADGSANLEYVFQVLQDIRPDLTAGSVVVIKSTVPVGSGQKIIASLHRADVHVVSNPEFLREGSALHDFDNPDRVVIGAGTSEAGQRVASLYRSMKVPILETSIESAELIKYATNSYLATRLSFLNELAELCSRAGADVEHVIQGLGSDSRIGTGFLEPGPGWGGSCFPKDTRALVAVAKNFGLDMSVVQAAIDSNDKAFDLVADKLLGLLGGSAEKKTIAVWGLAFKANTDDVRESPAIGVIQSLLRQGAIIRAYDPVARAILAGSYSQETSASEAVKGAHALLVLTEWSEFSDVDAARVAAEMKGSIVYDTRRVLDRNAWQSKFEVFERLGESSQ